MIVTVVAVMCFSLSQVPVCHEEIVVKDNSGMMACLYSLPAVADWKMHSKFKSDDWRIERVRCIPGDYEPKDAI